MRAERVFAQQTARAPWSALDADPVQLLQAMPENGTVALIENRSADMHPIVLRADPQDVGVAGGTPVM